MQTFRRFAPCALPLAAGAALAALAAPVRAADDAARARAAENRRLLDTIGRPLAPRLPRELLTDEARRILAEEAAGARERTTFFTIPHHAPAQAAVWAALPTEHWDAVIAACAPLTGTRRGDPCPFCGRPLRMLRCDLAANPRQGTTPCCGATVYARESDTPAAYAAWPNRPVTIPHLDGTTHTYAFHARGGEDDPAIGFCGEGELWWSRLHTLLYQVIPDLGAEVYRSGDAACAGALAAILDRLADVYPGIPYTDPARAVPFACTGNLVPGSRDKAPLGAAAWRAELDRRRSEPDTVVDYETTFAKLPYSGTWGAEGDLVPLGILAEAFDLVRRHPAAAAFSRAKHGRATAFERRVRERLFEEAALYFRLRRPSCAHTMAVWLNNAIKLAVAAQDEALLAKAARMADGMLANGYVADGLPVEGAFEYAAATGWYGRSPWLGLFLPGADLPARHPGAARIAAAPDDYPIVTLLNVESRHGEQAAAFLASARRPPPAAAPDPAARAPSQHFPFAGLTCLRAGGPGARLEAILDHQNQVLHTHPARLNLQLVYEGVSLVPDLGAADRPDGGINRALESHATGAINGTQLDRWAMAVQRFAGGRAPGDPAAEAAFVDVEGAASYAHVAPGVRVSAFRRQLLAVPLPGGRVCLLDVFRMAGGRRHNVFWHVPAADPATAPGAPQRLAATNLLDWFAANADPPPGWLRETEYGAAGAPDGAASSAAAEALRHFHAPGLWAPSGESWQATWTVDPAAAAPADAALAAAYAPWGKLLQPVTLRLWGLASGSTASQAVLTARAPWTAIPDGSAAGRLTLEDGLSVLAVHRQGHDSRLASVFTHVLEPWLAAQGPALKSLEPIRPDAPPSGEPVALRAFTAAGAHVFMGVALDGGAFAADDFEFRGRAAVAAPADSSLWLFDGAYARGEHLAVQVEDSWRAALEGVAGDLSGEPDQSALLVRCDRPIPEGDLLAGHALTVHHRTDPAHTSGFALERVTRLADGRYRLDLRGRPPLIHNRLHVTAWRPAQPRRVDVDMKLFAGVARPTGLNRIVRFPRSGLQTTLTGMAASGEAGCWSRTLYLAEDAPPEAVRPGDLAIVYTLQPGDTVVIPSLFACSRSPTDGARRLEVYTTGAATLQLSEPCAVAAVAGSCTVARSAEATAISFPPGRHAVLVEPPQP